MANVVGKRYLCQVCGSEFIVTKGGDGCLQCHGRPLQLKEGLQRSANEQPQGGSAPLNGSGHAPLA